MPFEILARTTIYEVSDEPALDVAHNPQAGQFLPEVVAVHVHRDQPTHYLIEGPMLDAKGKPLKIKRGSTGFSGEDIEAGNVLAEDTGEVLEAVPAWLIEIGRDATDKSLRLDEAEIRALLKVGNLGYTAGPQLLPARQRSALDSALGTLTSSLYEMTKENNA